MDYTKIFFTTQKPVFFFVVNGRSQFLSNLKMLQFCSMEFDIIANNLMNGCITVF